MNKEEFINYCNKNGFVYRESPQSIDIDKIIDHLENTYPYITYEKEGKHVIISDEEKNYTFTDADIEMLLYLKGGSNE